MVYNKKRKVSFARHNDVLPLFRNQTAIKQLFDYYPDALSTDLYRRRILELIIDLDQCSSTFLYEIFLF